MLYGSFPLASVLHIIVYVCQCVCTHAQLFSLIRCCDPWTEAHQAPLSMGFFQQEYWDGLSFHPPGDLPDPEIEPMSQTQVFCTSDGLFSTEPPGKPHIFPLGSIKLLSLQPVVNLQNFLITSFCFTVWLLTACKFHEARDPESQLLCHYFIMTVMEWMNEQC